MLEVEEVSPLSATPVPSPPVLRPYQKQFVADLYTQIGAGVKRILGFSSTGSGKTLIMAQVVAHATAKGRRTLFIVHRDTLISQTYDKLSKFGLSDCGFIKSGWKEDRDALVQVASVQTLARRNWWHQLRTDVVILDEAHLTSFHTVVKEMMSSIHPQAIYLGLTATPWRLSKHESMSDIYQAIVSAPMPHELIDAGFLVKPSYFSPNQADLERVGKAANGDFDESQLAFACDRFELVEKTVRDWFNLAYGRRTIVFAVNVAHARHLAEAFIAAGVSAAHVDGTMVAKETERIYQQLAIGELCVLASCQKLVEGFDVPSVSAVILARPTHSRSLHFQTIGRGLRLSPETNKTDCIVIDTAGNVLRHGFVEDVKNITLFPSEDLSSNDAPKKICPPASGGCSNILYGFQMKCPKCGYVFEQVKKVYLLPQLEQLLSAQDIERFDFYRQKLRLAYEKNLDPGWAAHSFREKYGHWPPDPWSRGAVFGSKPTPLQQSSYRSYLETIAQHKQKSDSWIERFMKLEFGFDFQQAV